MHLSRTHDQSPPTTRLTFILSLSIVSRREDHMVMNLSQLLITTKFDEMLPIPQPSLPAHYGALEPHLLFPSLSD